MTSIAIQNSFPNQPHTAENEFVRRLQICAERLFVDTHVVTCSSEIRASKADFLLSLHEVSPKLTAMPTIGAMWNPPSGIRHDPTRRAFAGSFDGYLAASANVRQFIAELTSDFAGPSKPIADFRFFPTSPRGIAQAHSYDSLAYLGVHWDGARHGDVIDDLARRGEISLYGPEFAWRHVGSAYHGGIPFDGVSVIKRLAEHGIVLCLHREPHIADDTPSMRLFEAASAGCLILSDSIPYARDTFGDSIFILPDGECRADYVRETLAWARAHPARVREMARESQKIFEQQCSLDVLLHKVVKFGQSVGKRSIRRTIVAYRPWLNDCIDVFCVLNHSEASDADRAIATVNAQTHRNIRLLLIKPPGSAISPQIKPRFGVKVVTITAPREPSGWNEVSAPHVRSRFVASLSVGAHWSPTHLATLLATLRKPPTAEIASASRAFATPAGTYVSAPNFNGDTQILVQEDSLLDISSSKSADEISACRNVQALMDRSDWLMTSSTFRRFASGARDGGTIVEIDSRCTGHVTAFDETFPSQKPISIVFV